jgi:hypothetical protein
MEEDEEDRGGIGGRQRRVGEGSDADAVKKGGTNGNGKRFCNRGNSADSGIALPEDDNDSEIHDQVTNDSPDAAIATGTSTSFTFAGSTGWRYISLSDDEHVHGHGSHAADQDENVGLLHGVRFRGKRNKGKKVVLFANGIPGGDDDDDDADGKKKDVKGKNVKCERWLETLMVHGFGSIAHLYVPCVDFTTIDEKEVVVMPRQAQAHIVIFDDDGLEGIALRDL